MTSRSAISLLYYLIWSLGNNGSQHCLYSAVLPESCLQDRCIWLVQDHHALPPGNFTKRGGTLLRNCCVQVAMPCSACLLVVKSAMNRHSKLSIQGHLYRDNLAAQTKKSGTNQCILTAVVLPSKRQFDVRTVFFGHKSLQRDFIVYGLLSHCNC